MASRSVQAFGGRYKATQNPDGTWNLHDLPAFGEVPRGENGNQIPVDAHWHRRCLHMMQELEREGHLPPLHIYHHDRMPVGTPPKLAGRLRITGQRQQRVKGRPMSVLTADLVKIPPDVFSRIEREELPGLSVETPKGYTATEIFSAALLDSEPPYFPFPSISVGHKVPAASHQRGHGILNRPVEAHMKPYEDEEHMADTADVEEHEEDDDREEHQDETGVPSEDNDNVESHMMGAPEAGVPAIDYEKLAEMVAMKMAAMNQPDQMPDEAEPGPQPVEPEDLNGGEEQMMRHSHNRREPAEVHKLRAEVAGMKAAMAERDRREAHAKMVSDAEESLEGYYLTEETRANLRKIASHGKGALDTFVATLRDNLPIDPPETFEAFASPRALPDSEPELQDFHGKSPDELAEARKYLPLYRASHSRGIYSGDLASFIAAQKGDDLAAGIEPNNRRGRGHTAG